MRLRSLRCLRSLRASACALGLAAGSLAAVAPPAHAAESTTMIVTNQYGGSTCGAVNEQLLLIDPFSGVQQADLGTPNTSFGVFNEAKPFDLNRKIVALWGGSATYGQTAGIGVYDRTAGAWTMHKALPTSIERDAEAPHSITVLPGGYFALAHVGSISGAPAPNNGFVIVLDPSGNPVNLLQSPQISTAHGVEWDPARNALFAIGGMDVRKYSFSNGTLTLQQTYAIPSSGGHDLRRRRTDTDFNVTTNSSGYVFRPDAATKFTEIRRSDGATIGSWVKAIDERFDGVTEYAQGGKTFTFLDGRQATAGSCVNFYKGGRWLYAAGTPVLPEDGSTPPPQTTWSPTFTVGGGANTWWIEIYASSDVATLDVIGNDGQFYMSNVTKQSWGAFAQSPPVELTSGTPVKLVARKADGSTAASVTFGWLTGTPSTEPGWNGAVSVASCTSTSVQATAATGTTSAEVRIGSAAWAAMTYDAGTGRWTRSPGASAGTKSVVRAVRADGAKAYSPIVTC